jgi:hypothetical protein
MPANVSVRDTLPEAVIRHIGAIKDLREGKQSQEQPIFDALAHVSPK